MNTGDVLKADVIGGGLAGVEAAYALARNGISVVLHEMKLCGKFSPAHSYGGLAELVCSNSLKAAKINSAPGMLKEEMRLLGSLTMEAAAETAVPAGGALAVDRVKFSDYITRRLKSLKNVYFAAEEVADTENYENAVICTGPLTSDKFAEAIKSLTGDEFLSFYDAAAPIVTAESVDFTKAFWGDRYGKGNGDYLNCPLNKEEYDAFYNALINAKTTPLHDFEQDLRENSVSESAVKVYEGCMPVEIPAKRGYDALRFGCMKPVGLNFEGKRAFAVLQLRAECADRSMMNLVGFQTNLKFSEQKRVFGLVPALKNAEYLRYGVMHRNTFIKSPELLTKNLRLREKSDSAKKNRNIFFAGQITGVEGYCESAMTGIVAGISLARELTGKAPLNFPRTTMSGALTAYVSGEIYTRDFQPMGANMGILPPLSLDKKIKKEEKYALLAERGIADLMLMKSLM